MHTYGKKYFLLISLVLLGVFTSLVAKADQLVISSPENEYDLANKVEIFNDYEGKFGIREITSKAVQQKFTPLSKPFLHYKPPKTTWLKLNIKVSSKISRSFFVIWELQNANAEILNFYAPKDMGGFKVRKTGAMRPIDAKETTHRFFTFKIRCIPGTEKIYYLKIKSKGAYPLPFALLSPKALWDRSLLDSMSYGLIYGSLFSIALFNLFVFFSLRDYLYLKYVIYIFSTAFTLIFLNGHYMEVVQLPPGYGMNLFWVFLGFLIFFAAVFARDFLKTRQTEPKWDHIFTIAQVLGLLTSFFGVLGLTWWADLTAHLAGLAGPIFTLIIASKMAFQKDKGAQIFLSAWSLFLVGTIVFVLGEIGVLPPSIPGPAIFSLGAATESILLSLALAYRIRTLQKEKMALAIRGLRYRTESLTDGLTGLFNYRFFKENLKEQINNSLQDNQKLSLLIMDLDDFKNFNDSYGHQQGDEVLRSLAKILRKNSRQTDFACRYGGEEFVLVMPKADISMAQACAKRINKTMANHPFVINSNLIATATVSIGAAEYKKGETTDEFIKRADNALYRAKKQGKNKVVNAA